MVSDRLSPLRAARLTSRNTSSESVIEVLLFILPENTTPDPSRTSGRASTLPPGALSESPIYLRGRANTARLLPTGLPAGLSDGMLTMA